MSNAVGQALFALLLAVIAAAYAALGQGGATGYIAVMGLTGYSPDIIRPTALLLNTLVASIAAVQFARARLLPWRSLFPFAILGVPASLLGGATHLSAVIYHPLVGTLLLVAAWRMASKTAPLKAGDKPKGPPFWPSLLVGALLGFIAGITGIGGGILLAPLMLTLGWGDIRQASAVAAVFNLLNSGAAFIGLYLIVPDVSLPSLWWVFAAACGGLAGSWLALRRLPPWALRYALAGLLVIAGIRMIWS
jgi:hypothetical protein